jgi:hypothetical protein
MSKRKKSIVWDYFTTEDNKSKCNECNSAYGLKTSSTILKNHLIEKHNIDFFQKKNKKKMVNEISIKKTDLINDLVAKFIINDYKPFNIVEDKYLKESYQELGYQLPGRTFFKNFIKKDFEVKREKFKEYLKKFLNKVSITFDL